MAKPARYRAGQVPKFAQLSLEEEEEEEDGEEEVEVDKVQQKKFGGETLKDGVPITRLVPISKLSKEERIKKVLEHDLSLRPKPRVAEVLAEDTVDDMIEVEEPSLAGEQQKLIDNRKAQQIARGKLSVPIIATSYEEEEEEEEEEEHDRRRARALQKKKQREEEELPIEPEDGEMMETVEGDRNRLLKVRREGGGGEAAEEEEEEEEEEEGSEYESESESEEELPSRPMIAPIFKRKEERATQAEAEKMEALEMEIQKQKEKRLAEKKMESKEMLEKELKRREEEAESANKSDDDGEDEAGMPDDSDEVNQKEEFERWKLRELARIKKEREEKEKHEKEMEDLDRRRDLTDEQIMREDEEKLKPREKKKWNYLQKYYHKGAFFRTFDEEDKIADEGKWDFNQPTLEDKLDKSILPEVMQVKNFGKSGRTKYTHLKKEDTTDFQSGWFENDLLKEKYKRKRAGTGDVYNKRRRND